MSQTIASPSATASSTAHAPSFWRRALRNPSFIIGAVLSLALLLAAGLSYVWTPWSPFDMNIDNKLQGPSALHWLGTDAYGRDVASQLLVGARNSILVGVVAVGIGLSIGTALGLLAAAKRGWVEEAIMRLSDFTFAFPAILSAIMMTAVFGAGIWYLLRLMQKPPEAHEPTPSDAPIRSAGLTPAPQVIAGDGVPGDDRSGEVV